MAVTLEEIWRFPVKGLSGERLAQVDLTPHEALPYDRAFAIENGAGKFDPLAPKHLPKIAFFMLMRHEKLAALETRFEVDKERLVVMREGQQVAAGVLSTPTGRAMIAQFFSAYLGTDARATPRVVSAPGHVFSDMATPAVHIVNLASVRELERTFGAPVDPMRFRANLIIDGAPAWSEFDWVDRDITIGNVVLRGFCQTERCAATEVNPSTAERDMSLPRHLERHFGHTDFGIYATVKTGGTITTGAELGVAETA
ncbi:MAG: MOSC domain-containing protein [Pseudomonadota bacterium]